MLLLENIQIENGEYLVTTTLNVIAHTNKFPLDSEIGSLITRTLKTFYNETKPHFYSKTDQIKSIAFIKRSGLEESSEYLIKLYSTLGYAIEISKDWFYKLMGDVYLEAMANQESKERET